MGRVDPLSFSRGKRGIAGTIVTLMLDQHVLYGDALSSKKFVADKDEIYPDISQLNLADASDLSQDLADPDDVALDATNLSNNYAISQAWYVDQLPPFDIVIVAANEYGNAASMRIYGIEVLNEGTGFSVDDVVIDNQMTYVCRTILPWQKLGHWDFGATEGGSWTAASSGSY